MKDRKYNLALKRNISLYYLINSMTGLIFTIPIWVYFVRRVMSFSQVATFQAIGFALSVVMELPSGALADMIGRRKTVILGWLISAGGFFYEGIVADFMGVVVGIMAIAFGGALVSGADTALVYDSLKELKKEADFSKLVSRGNFIHRLSMILAIFFGGYLYELHISLPYILRGVAQLLVVGMVFMMVEPMIDSEKFSLGKYMKQLKIGAFELVKSHRTKLLSLFYVLVGGITWSVLYYFMNSFAFDSGYSPKEQSWLFSAIYIITTLMIVYVTERKRQINRKIVYLAFPIIMIISLLPGFWVSKLGAAFVLFGIILAGGARFSILDGYVNEEFESKYRATALSALNLLVSLFCIGVIGLSGKVQDIYTTRLVMTGLGVLSLLFVLPVGWKLVRNGE